MASRAGGLPSPPDGVSTRIDEPTIVENDAAYAARLGFSGKLLIHLMQVTRARRGFRPSAKDIAWARKIVAGEEFGLAMVDGIMVDRPVRLRAEQILSRTSAGEDLQ